jgi:hypothetical protein
MVGVDVYPLSPQHSVELFWLRVWFGNGVVRLRARDFWLITQSVYSPEWLLLPTIKWMHRCISQRASKSLDRPVLPLFDGRFYIVKCYFDESNSSVKVVFKFNFTWWFSFLLMLLLDKSGASISLRFAHIICWGNAVAPSYCVAGLTRVSLVPSSVGVWSLL